MISSASATTVRDVRTETPSGIAVPAENATTTHLLLVVVYDTCLLTDVLSAKLPAEGTSLPLPIGIRPFVSPLLSVSAGTIIDGRKGGRFFPSFLQYFAVDGFLAVLNCCRFRCTGYVRVRLLYTSLCTVRVRSDCVRLIAVCLLQMRSRKTRNK